MTGAKHSGEQEMTTWKSTAAALAAGALMALAPAVRAADSGLVVFDWSGYEDPNFYQAYIDKHGDGPTFGFFGDEEEAFQKLRSGFRADAAHPCAQSVPKWIEAGLLEPIDTSKIPRWKDLNPAFRDIKAFQKDGKYYFVPMDWGNTALTYNTDLLTEADVESLQAFADPKHTGRVSIGDNVDDAYALAFLALGIKDWSAATDEQFQAASAFLRKVHKNVRSYWADGASLAQLMTSGEVYLAWAWNETFSTLSAEGYPIKMKRDTKEGASSWVCGYVKLKDGQGSDEKFYDFINAWLEPSTVSFIVNDWGYGHSNMVEMAKIPEADLEAVGLESSDKLRAGTLWQGPQQPEMRLKMVEEFEKIKAGF